MVGRQLHIHQDRRRDAAAAEPGAPPRRRRRRDPAHRRRRDADTAPRRRTIAHLGVLGAVNIAIPFWLIGWAEQHIDSGLAGILQSTAPFFTLVIAASFIHDERITPGRLAGIGLGFLGILVLSVENLADFGSAVGAERLLAELAVVGQLWPAPSATRTPGATWNTRSLVLAGTRLLGRRSRQLPRLPGRWRRASPAVPEAAFSVLAPGRSAPLAYIVFFRLLTGWVPRGQASLPTSCGGRRILGVVVLGRAVDTRCSWPGRPSSSPASG
jgi:drug/metabolite transporter (DMT)-like permease